MMKYTAAMLLVCLGMASAALGAGTYHEAPMLAELVKAGKLPPVAERLPDEPVVLEPIRRIGKYGGTWRRMAVLPSDSLMGSRLGYEPLIRWDRTGRKAIPCVAKSWEVHDNGKTCILHLRPGMKWSDGHPFTSEDILFWYEDIALNKELSPVFPTYLCPAGGRFSVTAPDRYTVAFHFSKPNGVFLETLCYRGHYVFHPKHYLKQFHAKYVDEKELTERAKAAGFDLWRQYFFEKYNVHENPDLPTLRSWKIVVPPLSTRLIVERNPYYWKVDQAGNQLPYIDRIAFTMVQNKEVLNLKAMTGGVHMQARYIDTSKYTLFMENREKGGYRVLARPERARRAGQRRPVAHAGRGVRPRCDAANLRRRSARRQAEGHFDAARQARGLPLWICDLAAAG